MQIKLDFRSGIPIYVQIIDQIKHLVATGALHPDDQLPTVRQLASELRVNFNTIARAYRMLDEAGVISTQQGRGTYILAPPSPEATERVRQEALQGLTRRYLANAARLSYSPAEVAELVQRYIRTWQEQGSPPDPGIEEI
jgi:GntR family transcriptional regulator